MSTSTSRPPRSKKLSCCVRPGVLETRASALCPVSAFSRLDLPTLERPQKATSGRPGGGSPSSRCAAWKKRQGRAKSSRPASISPARSSSVRASERPPAGGRRGRSPPRLLPLLRPLGGGGEGGGGGGPAAAAARLPRLRRATVVPHDPP